MTQIPKEWVLTSLEDLVGSISNGLTYSNNPNSGGLPISRIQTISKSEIDFSAVGYAGVSLEGNERYLLAGGDILFSHINSKEHVGKVAQYREGMPKILHGMNLLRIVPNEAVLPEFLLWVFRTDFVRDQIRAVTRHAVNQASVNIRNLSRISIPLPPIGEQKRIVETLEGHISRLDRAVEEIDAQMKQLQPLRTSLLRKAFSNFTSDGFDASGSRSLKELLTVRYGKDVSKADRTEHGKYPVVGSAGIMTYTNLSLTTKPAVIVGRKGNVGSVQIFMDGCHPVDTAYLLEVPNAFEPKYLYYQLQSKDLKSLDSSTAIPSLRRQDLEAVDLIVPPLEIQRSRLETLEAELSHIDAAHNRLVVAKKSAETLRRSLLHAAFTGQFTNEDAND